MTLKSYFHIHPPFQIEIFFKFLGTKNSMLRLKYVAKRYNSMPAAPTRKRFYKDVGIEQIKSNEDQSTSYRIKLDQRNLLARFGFFFKNDSTVLANRVSAKTSETKLFFL